MFSTYYFITANTIDLKDYKFLCFNSSVTLHSNGNGGHFLKVGLWDKKEYVYFYSTTYGTNLIQEPKMEQDYLLKEHSSVTNKKITIDISQITQQTYITAGITSGGANDSISANVYEVWLEK